MAPGRLAAGGPSCPHLTAAGLFNVPATTQRHASGPAGPTRRIFHSFADGQMEATVFRTEHGRRARPQSKLMGTQGATDRLRTKVW